VLVVTLLRAARVLEYSRTTRIVSSFYLLEYSILSVPGYRDADLQVAATSMLLSAASQHVGFTITSSQFASTSISFT